MFWWFQVLKESFKIYCSINDGIINLIDKVKYFDYFWNIICCVMTFWIMSFFLFAIKSQFFSVFWDGKTWSYKGIRYIQESWSAGNTILYCEFHQSPSLLLLLFTELDGDFIYLNMLRHLVCLNFTKFVKVWSLLEISSFLYWER